MKQPSVLIQKIRFLITMDPRRRILSDGAVLVVDGKVAEVGKSGEVGRDSGAELVIDATGKVAIPGLINCHTHIPYFLMRGLGDNLSLPTWLSEYAVPVQSALKEDEAYTSSLATLAESLKCGVTTVVDTGEGKVESVPRAVKESGIRAVVGKAVHDVPNKKSLLNGELATGECLKRAEDFYRANNGQADGRLRVWFSPSHERAVSDELLRGCGDLARRLGAGVVTHTAASLTSVMRHNELFGIPAVKRFERAGVLGENLLLIHANWLSDEEVSLVKRSGTKVCHCPSSAIYGAFGTFSHGRFLEMMGQGVTVALGSDNAAHSNFLDMLRVAQLDGAFRDVRGDPSIFPPETLLEMLTLNGAKALLDPRIGAIEAGRAADIVLFDSRRLEWQPLHSPVSNLLNSACGSSVDTVLVDGRVVVEGGVLKTVDEGELLDRVARTASELRSRLGIEKTMPWPVE